MKHAVRILITMCLLQLIFPLVASASKTHVVTRSSETLQSIARKYHVSVSELKAVNSLSSSSRVKKGASLIIPTQAEAESKPIENCSTYKVRKGDTLLSIARKTGVNGGHVAQGKQAQGQQAQSGTNFGTVTATSDTSCELPVAQNSSMNNACDWSAKSC